MPALTAEEKKLIPDWIKGESFVVVEPMRRLNWGGRGLSQFCCGFCLKIFEVGDTARWVYVEGRPNTFVCEEHDGPDVVERFIERWDNVIRPILNRWGS